MITLPPYIYDYDIYPLVPQADRWVFNKLILAERLGYQCGPIGVRPGAQLNVCVRPMVNMGGMGRGGFFQYDDWPFVAVDVVPNANPGYFWCEWFDGDHNFTSFIDDVAVYNGVGKVAGPKIVYVEDIPLNDAVVLPAFLQGLSKYMYAESLGGKIIEVSFRHSPITMRQSVIDDYQANVDSTWIPPTDGIFGIADMEQVADPAGGFHWISDETTRRPLVQN